MGAGFLESVSHNKAKANIRWEVKCSILDSNQAGVIKVFGYFATKIDEITPDTRVTFQYDVVVEDPFPSSGHTECYPS